MEGLPPGGGGVNASRDPEVLGLSPPRSVKKKPSTKDDSSSSAVKFDIVVRKEYLAPLNKRSSNKPTSHEVGQLDQYCPRGQLDWYSRGGAGATSCGNSFFLFEIYI